MEACCTTSSSIYLFCLLGDGIVSVVGQDESMSRHCTSLRHGLKSVVAILHDSG